MEFNRCALRINFSAVFDVFYRVFAVFVRCWLTVAVLLKVRDGKSETPNQSCHQEDIDERKVDYAKEAA